MKAHKAGKVGKAGQRRPQQRLTRLLSHRRVCGRCPTAASWYVSTLGIFFVRSARSTPFSVQVELCYTNVIIGLGVRRSLGAVFLTNYRLVLVCDPVALEALRDWGNLSSSWLGAEERDSMRLRDLYDLSMSVPLGQLSAVTVDASSKTAQVTTTLTGDSLEAQVYTASEEPWYMVGKDEPVPPAAAAAAAADGMASSVASSDASDTSLKSKSKKFISSGESLFIGPVEIENVPPPRFVRVSLILTHAHPRTHTRLFPLALAAGLGRKKVSQTTAVVVTVRCKDVRAPSIAFPSTTSEGFNAAVGKFNF